MLGMELCATVVFFMVLVHLAARATDTGISTATAVTLLSVIGLVNMVSKRRRLLKYLTNEDVDRYQSLIARLGLRR